MANSQKIVLYVFFLQSLTLSCGGLDADPNERPLSTPYLNTEELSSSFDLIDDSFLAGEDINSHIIDVTSSIINIDVDLSSTFVMKNENIDKVTTYRNCKIEASHTKVSINHHRYTRKANTNQHMTRFINLESVSATAKHFEGIDLSPPFSCSPSSFYLNLTAEGFLGLKLRSNFKQRFAHSHMVVSHDSYQTYNRSNEQQGQRIVKWLSAKTLENSIILTKAVDINLEKNLTRLNKNKEERKTIVSLETPSLSPLQVTVIRHRKSQKWMSRMVSGVINVFANDNGKMMITFYKTLWTREKGCHPQSGRIFGTAIDPDSFTSFTFAIDLDQDNKVIKFSDGRTASFDLEGCPLALSQKIAVYPLATEDFFELKKIARKPTMSPHQTTREATGSGQTK